MAPAYWLLIFVGHHYWYNLTSDTSCDDIWPMFLLYNKGELNAFGWAFQELYDSPRYEHPTSKILRVSCNFQAVIWCRP